MKHILLSLVLSALSVSGLAADRPNILFILADDMGFADAGCYGGEIATPNLDRLAANGVRFTQFYNTARCWPTRSALLSGYYPQQIRMDPPDGRLPEWTRLLPHHLKPLGYRSYHSGKWHINGAPLAMADGGFDRSYRLEDHDRNFYPTNHWLDDVQLPPVPRGSNYYTSTACADFMIDCLKTHAEKFRGQPFFAYLAFTVPHFPLQAPPEDIARYLDRYRAGWDVIRQQRYERQLKMGLVKGALSPPEPDVVPHWNLKDTELKEQVGPGEVARAVAWSALNEEQRRFQATKMAIHAAMIDRMDREIGRVLDQLRAMGALENTLVMFASDNGASAEFVNRGDKHDQAATPGSGGSYLCLGPGWSSVGNTPFRLHKSWVHEGGIATPLIVQWPAGLAAEGELRHAPGHVIDFVPTVLELAGARPEPRWNGLAAPPLPGRSLVPALASDVELPREFLYFHHDHNRALRVGDWKLVSRRPETNDYALYLLAGDRAEQNNLAAREPERVRRMAATWEAVEKQFRAQAGMATNQPLPDDWPRYGHDEALTGRSSLTGRITSPRTAWTYQTGGREWLVEIVPTPGAHTLQLDASRAATVAPSRFRPPARPVFDLDGTGTLRPPAENYHERWAKILPDVKGWQRVAWNETWTDQKVCRLQLFAYDQGFNRPRLVWQTDPPEGTIFQPLNLIYDLDGDGVQEICVAAHYRVMIFEGTTGRKETELRYHQSRPYGWFGLANVDATGPMELITIGDFQSHIDVLNYDPAKPEKERLAVRWRRDIEQAIEDRTKWPQVGPHPVADVAGDARLELVLNLFNDTGDGQWHAVVLDASTGVQVQDFPRRFLQGTVDIDGDGKAELFLASTEGVLVAAFGMIELVSLRPAGPVVRWFQENAAWGCADLPRIESTWSTTASQGMRDILVSEPAPGERPTFLVSQRKTKPDAQSGRSPAPSTTLRAMSSALSGVILTNWEVTGLPDDFQFVTLSTPLDRAGIGVSMRMKVSRDTVLSLDCQRAEAQVTESQPLGVPVSTPIAARLRPDGLPVVVVEGAAREIFALQADKTGTNAPHVLWRLPGRGMGDGSRWLGPLAADLDGDNGKEIVVATADGAGRAVLVAYRHDGSVLWQARFDQIPGATPVWNLAALTFWWPGCFRTNGQIDLFVNTRRGPMHSDIGQLLDGRTGALIWRQDKAALPGQFSWGYAGIPPAVSDVDDDGSAELISLYPVCFWVADGRTGRLKQGVELASRKRLPAWAAYGEPMIYPFTGQKNAEVLLDSQYILGLLDIHGAPLWHAGVRPDFPTSANDGSLGQTTQVKHALIDFDGDGVFEIGSAGYGDGVRAIDPRNGQTLWSLPAPAPTCARVVAANIDGRKGDELIYVAGSKLVAVTGDRRAGKILWEWQGPTRLSMPAIADLNGDGFAEIIVQAADGSVFCIDQ